MRLTLATILGLCALASGRCGTQQHENIAGMHVAYQAYEAAIAAQPVRRQDKTYSINTYVYVITQNNTVAGGHISQRAIDQQVSVADFCIVSPLLHRSSRLTSSRWTFSIPSIRAQGFRSRLQTHLTITSRSGEMSSQAARPNTRWRAVFARATTVTWTFMSTQLQKYHHWANRWAMRKFL